MPDGFDFDAPNERMVDGWLLRSDVPLISDKQGRQAARSSIPKFPFEHMKLHECFDVLPERIGETDLLRTANIVSRAASTFKYASKDGLGNIQRDFATRQIGNRLVRCHRTF